MYAALEENPAARSDCNILSLSWKGTVPESEKDKSYSRKRHCNEGWLSSGNSKGIVGATFTTSHCKPEYNVPSRTNFNLRGHSAQVVLVSWNEPFQKMATCDSNGVIFVWIKYEGRWSIELVNDRTCQVCDFGWSHDGRMALICYKDGFVLVGSVAGQRYWSSMLNLDSKLLCGAWTPDDKQVLFGTSDGQIIVMDIHGAMVTQCTLSDKCEIHSISWSCEKFRMINVSDSDQEDGGEKRKKSEGGKKRSRKRITTMAVNLGNGNVYLMKAYDDLSPLLIKTCLTGLRIEWSSCGSVLAIGGVLSDNNSVVKFYNINGHLRFILNVPSQKPLSALTWGHNDNRLFIACGPLLHVAWIQKKVAPLQFLCREILANLAEDEKTIAKLPLPSRIKDYVQERFSETIKGCIPDPCKLKEFVSQPPTGSERLHCTMIRTGDDCSYTLYLEYLGGLLPLLKGKRISKLRPEFVIYDPTVINTGTCEETVISGESSSSMNSSSDMSDNESPSRHSCRKTKKKLDKTKLKYVDSGGYGDEDKYNPYLDQLPEENRLVEVTSNIWGTKFKIHGVSTYLPPNLGAINYKTSLLHLQPRQMTIVLPELRTDTNQTLDINFNTSLFSEDDEDSPGASNEVEENLARPAPVAPVHSTTHSPTSPISRDGLSNQVLDFKLHNEGASPELDISHYKKQGAIPKTKTSKRKPDEEKMIYEKHSKDLRDQVRSCDDEAIDGLEMNMPRWADSACRLLQNEQVSAQLDVSPDAVFLASYSTADLCPSHITENHPMMGERRHTLDRSASQEKVDKRRTNSTMTADREGESPKNKHHLIRSRTPTSELGLANRESESPKIKHHLIRSRTPTSELGLANRESESPKNKHHLIRSRTPPSELGLTKCKRDDVAVKSRTSCGRLKSISGLESSDSDGEAASSDDSPLPSRSRRKMKKLWNESCQNRVFVMHNKAPLWNENTQVYQLDFGGRVTQESAKNFQIELHGKQVKLILVVKF
ncbi:tubby-related protein 4-like [Saccoglossus kowalevskii]